MLENLLTFTLRPPTNTNKVKTDYSTGFFSRSTHTSLDNDDITLGLSYNIMENGFYLTSSWEDQVLRKDMSRSLALLLEILERYMAFSYVVVEMEDNLEDFIRTVSRKFDPEVATYLLVGSRGYNYKKLLSTIDKLLDYSPADDEIKSNLTAIATLLSENLQDKTSYNLTTDELLEYVQLSTSNNINKD